MDDLMSNVGSKLRASIASWISDNAGKYLFVVIPKEHTDVDYDTAPLVPMRDYFRVWLAEMFLTKSRTWFVNWFPAVHTTLDLKITGQQGTSSLSHVAQGPGAGLANGVFVNYAVCDLLPYMGGLVTIESSLLALKGSNDLESAIKVLQDFSTLVAPPIGQALAVANKLTSGMQDLFNSKQGQVHVGWHQTFASQGGGGNNILRPGYLAVILASPEQVDPNCLTVVHDRLQYTKEGGAPAPMLGYDYLLYRIEGRLERDDWRFPEIDQAINKAAQAYLNGHLEEAKAEKNAALNAAIASPYLAVQDRRRVVRAIEAELSVYEAGGQGAVGEEIPDLDKIMAARAMNVQDAIKEGPITYEEVFGS